MQTVSKEQSGDCEISGVSTGIDKKVNALGGGALEVGDHCLLEDGGERGGALGSDVVATDTASEGQDGLVRE